MVNIYGTKAKLDKASFCSFTYMDKTQTRYEAMFIANTYVTNLSTNLFVRNNNKNILIVI